MAITSEDIHNQSFTVDRKGYDVDEVDVFLEHVAAEIDGLNAQIEELLARIDELNNNQMGFDDDEPMDMDAAFAEPAMPEPEPEAVKEEAADTTSVLSADEKDARIAELEKQLSEKETDASAIANALVTAQRSAQEVLDAARAEAKRIHNDAEIEASDIVDRANAEKAKIELSSSTTTEINLPYITAVGGVPKHLVKTLTRAKFEQLADNLIQACKVPCQKAMQDAGLSNSDIDEVILVGGSSRIPAIQKLVEDFFGKAPSKGVNPDEVVAVGASIQGAILNKEAGVGDIVLLDVTPLSMGIETMGGVMTKLIEANTTIPCNKSEVFSTAADNQTEVTIHVLQGERPMAAQNKSIGQFNLTGIAPARRGVPQIEVTFDIDANGILKVSAKDKATGKEQAIRIEASSGLSKDEIDRMKAEAEANADADKKERERVDKMNQADSMIFQTENQLKELGDKIPADKKPAIEGALQKLKDAHKAGDVAAIDAAIAEMNAAWQAASAQMYQGGAQPGAGAQQNAGGQSNTNAGNSSSDDSIQDADFEEVK